MKKITVVMFAFCLFGLSLSAQEKVAIIPFTGGSGDEGNAIAQILKTEFTKFDNFQIASQTQSMDNILKDENIQKTGITHGDTIVRLGKSTNAKYIVSGHIQSLGRKKIVLTSIIHVKTYQQIAGDYYEYFSFDEVINYLPALAEKLINKTKTDYLNLPTLAILPFHGIDKDNPTGLGKLLSILPFNENDDSTKSDESNAKLLPQLLAIEIANSGKYAVISRKQTLENIMEEQNIKIRNLAHAATAAKLGKGINAQFVLSGTVSPIGPDDLMNMSLIEVSSLAQESGAYVKYKTIREGARLMLVLSSELTGVLSETILSLSIKDTIALYEGEKDIETIKELVAKNINATDTDNSNYTPLIYASKYGYTEIVTALIEEGADIEAKSDYHEQTALYWAAYMGHTETVKVLIARGADIDAQDDIGYTALYEAANMGHPKIVKILIEEGADINVKGFLDATILMEAAEGGHTEVVKILIEAGADIDVQDGLDNTALIQAAKEGHTEVVALLIEARANLDAINDVSETALYYGARDHPEILKILLEAGVNLETKDKYGNTTLIEAADRGYTNAVEALIEAGANLDAKDNSGNTALMAANNEGATRAVKALIAGGADIDAQNNRGMTALIYAASQGHSEIVKALIEAGANLNAKSNYGWNATMMAATEGYPDIVNLLEAADPKYSEYKIGDTGPGGGMVFYIAGNKYLESSEKLGETDWYNTMQMIEDYRGGGYDDWYLPTTNELNYIYENLRAKGFESGDDLFWSSYKNTNYSALVQRFSDGSQYDRHETATCSVRAIRASDTDIVLKKVDTKIGTLSKSPLSIEDAITLHERDDTKRDGKRVIELIKELTSKGINATDDSNTPLMYASIYGYTEIANALIAAGANIEAKDDSDETPVIRAATLGYTEIVKSLIKAGANINAKDKYNRTPLINAAKNGQTETVTVLVKEGANLEIKAEYDYTALMRAIMEKHTKIVTLLIKAGADIEVKDDTGRPALLLAAWAGSNTEIVKILIEAGADINVKDKSGRTALRWAINNYYTDIANVLKEAGASE